jgi:hypothetical protein
LQRDIAELPQDIRMDVIRYMIAQLEKCPSIGQEEKDIVIARIRRHAKLWFS